ncbi:MAG: Crp/Fnr family transcriptional regulator [Comamonadaceae bacterium]|nr:Crp/Fnr family transcriptional regulator [Comamonadaceae bacterium]
MFCLASPAERFICRQPWFASLEAKLQQEVRSGVYETQGAKGAVLLPAGSPAQGWHAVLSGLVMLRSTQHRARTAAFIGVPDGEWFGEGTAMRAEAQRYEVIALRPTRLLCLPLALFEHLHAGSLEFNQYLAQHINLRLGQALTIIEAGRTRSAEQRVALQLSRLFWRSRRRLDITQEELGQLAGLSRQTINRALGALAAAGIVGLDFGRVAILDDTALDQFLATAASA